MPVAYFNNCIIEHLKEIGYTKPNIEFNPRDGLKNTILRGNGIDVNVLGDSALNIVLSVQQYCEAITTDFYFSYEKVIGQNRAVKELLRGSAPGAWILVTVYYQAFYAAIQIARLSGVYNVSLGAEHLDEINGINSATEKLKDAGVYVSRGVHVNSDGYISLILEKKGDKPHKSAWKNLDSLISKRSIESFSSRPHKYKLTMLLKNIICESVSQWPLPSQVRNDMNYSVINSYESMYCKKASELIGFFEDDDFSKVKNWGLKTRRDYDVADHISSVGFVSVILRQVIINLHSKFI